MKKNSDKIKISFIGNNSVGVAGSSTLVEYGNKKLLIECGIVQSSNKRKDFEANAKKPKEYKPKELTYVLCEHLHGDHTFLVPRLVRNGFEGKVIIPSESGEIFKRMLEDSAYICQRDAEMLTKTSKNKTEYFPFYDADDVDNTMNITYEYPENEIFKLDDEISFRFTPSGHIIRAMQLELFITLQGKTTKILYTSDIGSIEMEKNYCEKFSPVANANIVISESTYACKPDITQDDRVKDLEKMKSVILETCVEKKGSVLIPSFALDRSQNILTILYDMFHEDENFNIPIVYDSPLSIDITKLYLKILPKEQREKLIRVLEWSNLRMIRESVDSKASVKDNSPKICISSSGMLTNGRAVYYLQKYLPNPNCHILFIGYIGKDSLADKIREGKHKTLTIEGKPCRNACQITSLRSFTSHIQHTSLLNYLSSINCESVYLVHGELEGKIKFAKILKDKFEKLNKTTKVVAVNTTTTCTL